jgi:hypothetical protein
MAQYPPPPPSGGYPAPQMPGGYSPPMSGGYPAPQVSGGYPPPMSGGYPAPQTPGGYAPPQQSGSYAPPQVPGSYPALPVPPEIAQQVAAHRLGTLAQVYQANKFKLFAFAGLLLLITLVYIPFALTNHLGILVLLVLLATAGYAIYHLVTNYNLKAYVFTEGLIRARGSQVDVMRWEHIEAVWEKIVQYRYRGIIPLYKDYTYTVRRGDGAQFKFNSALKDNKLLGEAIQQEVTRRLLPQAIASYDSGSPVSFGPLTVSVQGVGKGPLLVPWNQVGQINFRRGWMSIRKQGSLLSTCSTRAATIPNLQVFLQLVEHGRRRATGGY